VLVAAGTADEVCSTPEDSLGQGTASRQVLKIGQVDEVAVDVYAHRRAPSERYQLSAVSRQQTTLVGISGFETVYPEESSASMGRKSPKPPFTKGGLGGFPLAS